ncbi:hypothetical protein [Paractinoplanes globisporus]|uniref:Uncharacterized protein n=1 Tax=Paractinoplanes globisporus TaxID=113565 RepID=A0ABW6WAS6_9ACTN|nr:hypothetical protein [Actinoplanes globisporus]
MPDETPQGRTRGRARVGRAIGKSKLPEHALTGILRQDVSSTDPIFVDPSGSRRRWLRMVAYAVGVLLILALAGVWVSQLVGPATPPPATVPPSVRPPSVSAS